jgi:hypothetical protein
MVKMTGVSVTCTSASTASNWPTAASVTLVPQV